MPVAVSPRAQIASSPSVRRNNGRRNKAIAPYDCLAAIRRSGKSPAHIALTKKPTSNQQEIGRESPVSIS
jgi:hypothetical protein